MRIMDMARKWVLEGANTPECVGRRNGELFLKADSMRIFVGDDQHGNNPIALTFLHGTDAIAEWEFSSFAVGDTVNINSVNIEIPLKIIIPGE